MSEKKGLGKKGSGNMKIDHREALELQVQKSWKNNKIGLNAWREKFPSESNIEGQGSGDIKDYH